MGVVETGGSLPGTSIVGSFRVDASGSTLLRVSALNCRLCLDSEEGFCRNTNDGKVFESSLMSHSFSSPWFAYSGKGLVLRSRPIVLKKEKN